MNLEKKEKKTTSKNLKYLLELKAKIENELRKIIDDMHFLLNKFLSKNPGNDVESKIFYLKLEADYYRYLAEISLDLENEKATDLAEQIYNTAYEMSKEINLTSPIKLGVALNLCVFLFEIKNNKDDACRIAKQTLE